MRLVICEKPSVAQSISAVLNAKKRRDGFFEGDSWLVSWCYGHLVELAPADAYDPAHTKPCLFCPMFGNIGYLRISRSSSMCCVR